MRGTKPSEAHLRFLKDVLYGLHVSAIEDHCSSLQETLQKKTFSHPGQAPALRPGKKDPGNLEKEPQNTSLEPSELLENGPKTGHQKKSLFAPGTPRGECSLRVLDSRLKCTTLKRRVAKVTEGYDYILKPK